MHVYVEEGDSWESFDISFQMSELSKEPKFFLFGRPIDGHLEVSVSSGSGI